MSTGTESNDRPRPDVAHLDEDAECLEDPVHCGDARHQHDAHAKTSPAAAAPPAADEAATATEKAQA